MKERYTMVYARHSLRIYAMEAALLGLFMVSACSFCILLEHPDSRVHHLVPDAFARRALMGLAMGATAVGLIYSSWGKRSGAHMNPAVTLSAWRLGRIGRIDAQGYIAAQFLGAVIGVGVMMAIAPTWISHSNVNYVATLPGTPAVIAWLAEAAIAFGMMGMSIGLNRFPRIAPYTGCFAGALVALYITFEAPISGMSLNPARSFGSAFWAHAWMYLWIYFTAPVAGMLSAVEVFRLFSHQPQFLCCKHTHSRKVACHCPCQCLERNVAHTFTSNTLRSEHHAQNA